MSVLVRGMEMPKNCRDCRFCIDSACVPLNYMLDEGNGLSRRKDCQLIEVPPHGRLIDADAMNEKYGDWYTEEGTEEGFIGALKYLIAEQSTIIGAEDGE